MYAYDLLEVYFIFNVEFPLVFNFIISSVWGSHDLFSLQLLTGVVDVEL